MIGCGKEILFLMPGALGSTRTHCSPLLDALSPKKYTTLCWDPPGNGHSDPYAEPPASHPCKDTHTAALFLKELGLSNITVVGWCGGGHTAMRLAANHPHLVKKLILVGSWVKVDEKMLHTWNNYRDIMTFERGWRDCLVKLYGYSGTQSRWSDFLDLCAKALDEGLDTFDASNDCRNIQCPTVVIHSTDDPLSDYESQAKQMVSLIPNSRLITLSGAGHFIHFTRTEEVIKLVEEIISD